MEMNPKLKAAAETGDINALHLLIKEDPLILEGDFDKIPFIQTPLHVAAHEGQTSFAMEMINLKPSFAKKLNRDGFSPMHLALINEKTKLVLQLLETDKDLVRVKGWEGMTPFHYAATRGDSKFLFEFLEACPECIEDVTVRKETALHLALKNNHLEAFKLLFGWLQRSRHGKRIFAFEERMVNWKDIDDNTVLHIAAMMEQREALKLLLDSYVLLDVKAKNCKGLTALEIIIPDEIRQGRGIKLTEEDDAKINQFRRKVNPVEKLFVMGARLKNCMSLEMINTMLVVTALVITAVYQSSLSPPGGVWQDDNSDLVVPNVTTTNHCIPGIDNFRYNNTNIAELIYGKQLKKAGTTIMSPAGFGLFWSFNVITFVFTVILTGFILSRFRAFLFLVIPLYYLVISYFVSMTVLSPSTAWSYLNIFFLIIVFFLPPATLLFALVLRAKSTHQQRVAEFEDRTKLRELLDMGKCDMRGILHIFYKLW